MEIPFVGGAYVGRSSNLNAQVCQNFFPVIDQTGAKSPLALMGTLGLILWCNTGTVAPVRGMIEWAGTLYAVVGAVLYAITSVGVATNVGTLSTSTGKVWMARGTTHLGIVDGTYGYYYDGSTLTVVTDSSFPTPTSLAYQDGYFIVTEDGTDLFYISGSEDMSSWDGLDFASAEDTPDDALVVMSYLRQLWVLGAQTYEVFYNSGDADFPFTRVAGAVRPVGIGAVGSAAAGVEGFFWLDDRFRVRMLNGYESAVISPPQLDYQIKRLGVKTDALGHLETLEGHSTYVLHFPGDSKTWAYDINTGMWHTRSSGLVGGRHRSNCSCYFAEKMLVGDYDNGKIYELDMGTYTDNGDPIKRIRTAQAVHADRKTLFHSQLEIEFEAGVGLASGQGSDPQAMLDWSDDGGHTWSNEHWASIGKIGEYGKRAVWRRLGRSKSRIYRLTVTDPVKIVILGAHLDAVAGTA